MRYRWSPTKAKILEENNRPSFEEVVEAIAEGRVIARLDHNDKYPGQFILIVELPPRKIFCAVPTSQNGDELYFHTVYPSEKLTKKYRKKE